MSAFLFKLLVLGNLLLLVLPPGWCCAAPGRSAETVAPKMATCSSCQQSSGHVPADSSSGPCHSEESCCSQVVAAVPLAMEKLLPVSNFSLPIAVVDDLRPRLDLSGEAGTGLLFIGPSLHVLKCVWLC